MELRVGGKYRLGRKIGSGSFGDIYLGKSASKLDHTDVCQSMLVACYIPARYKMEWIYKGT